ncbi:MAG: nicotinate phosphoribosyltransferase [Candidatus Eisenbacteria bacterium RBG_19FT_COMBO_70_11]|nr:MAG: nicotinate phosphoribosyltransferase [Candidatus Eisenbacteria bacterium RBG_19FT_COMBO_70_11]
MTPDAAAAGGSGNFDPLVRPTLTDLYQLTMAYAYWRSGQHERAAVFDLFFRRNPFGGEFTVCAGLDEAARFVAGFRFCDEDLAALRGLMPGCDEAFFAWLARVETSPVTIGAVPEGTLVFPREPLLRVEGPLALCQLLETTLLNLVNFPSLVATKAARMRLAAGHDVQLIEFGLRRAQGPDGAVSASRYSYVGGFDATSNVLAGQLFGIPVRGTHAHAYVSAFRGLGDLRATTLLGPDGAPREFLARVLEFRAALGATGTSDGELAAFVAYAQAFPASFLALVDTYDTMRSGVPNFLCVALALAEAGYEPVGVRLDSGDLAHLSKQTRRHFAEVGARHGRPFGRLVILASNEIDESVLLSLKQEGHEVNAFGIGTHLATCSSDPALGGIYKLVAIDGTPRIKLSEDTAKTTLPGKKEIWRLRGADGTPLLDLLAFADEAAPQPGGEILCCHPFDPSRRARVIPATVERLLAPAWRDGRRVAGPPLAAVRDRVRAQLRETRPDHLRPLNPTPYKVSVSERLYLETQEMLRAAPHPDVLR